jgi:hypothetical protein
MSVDCETTECTHNMGGRCDFYLEEYQAEKFCPVYKKWERKEVNSGRRRRIF